MFDIPREEYEAIAAKIESSTSPVGIDAKMTHILILHLLQRLDARLERLERVVGAS